MTFPRIWIAWLLALFFGFAAPAQAMRGLAGPGTPLGAKSHRVNNPINFIDPEGLAPTYMTKTTVLQTPSRNLVIKADTLGVNFDPRNPVLNPIGIKASCYGKKGGKRVQLKPDQIQSTGQIPSQTIVQNEFHLEGDFIFDEKGNPRVDSIEIRVEQLSDGQKFGPLVVEYEVTPSYKFKLTLTQKPQGKPSKN